MNRRLKYGIVTVGILFLCQCMKMIPVYRDTLINYFQITDSTFGLLLSLMVATGLVTVLPGGAFVDRYGPRLVLRISLAGVAGSCVLILLSADYWQILAAGLCLYGLSMRPLIVAVNNYLVRLFPNNRRRVLSLNFAGTSVGALFFPSVAETLLTWSTASAGVTFAKVLHWPYAGFALLIIAGTLLYRKRTAFAKYAGQSNSQKWHWRDMFLAPRHMIIVGLMALHGTADTTINLWMARFLGSDSFPNTPIGPGYILTGWAIAYCAARIILGFIPEKRGRKLFLVLPGILGGSVFIAGLLSGDFYLTAGGYILGAFLWSTEFPAMMGLLAHEESERFGAATSLHFLFTGTAALISLNGMGWLIDYLNDDMLWKAILIPASFYPIVGIGAFIWLSVFGKDLKEL